MSNRLEKQLEAEIEPIRLEYAIKALNKVGITEVESTAKSLKFLLKGKTITLYPYSGYFNGKGIKPGRGIDYLITQIKRLNEQT